MPLIEHIEGFEWLDWVIDKIVSKHHVQPDEVEECFFNRPYKLRRIEGGKLELFGRSDSGRYLFIIFAWKGPYARIVTARDMTNRERDYYGRK